MSPGKLIVGRDQDGKPLLPPEVAAEAQRILDGIARRLLAERVDGDPVRPTSGDNNSAIDQASDESP